MYDRLFRRLDHDPRTGYLAMHSAGSWFRLSVTTDEILNTGDFRALIAWPGGEAAMKRSWNWPVWVGVLAVLVGVFSYPLYFTRIPVLRDFPWVNLPLLTLGLVSIGVGVARAFRQPNLYRGKVFGSVLGALMVALTALFCYGIFVGARHVLPPSPSAPRVGQTAPDFTLPDSKNNPVNLTAVLNSPFAPNGEVASGTGAGPTAGVVLIFYRGYWWPFCNSELRSFEKALPGFDLRKIRVIAISVDPPADSENLRQSQGYTFPILSDANDEVIRRWGLVHPHGRRDGADISRPAAFLIDSSGKVRWVNLTDDLVVRARPQEALAAWDAMNKSSHSAQ
jgi:peroxiredoxin